MKLNSHLLLGIFFSILFVGCEKNDSPTPPIEGSRTVLVYIVADKNGLDEKYNSQDFATRDVEEMFEGMKSVDTSLYNLLVYLDNNDKPVLFRINRDKKGGQDMETLCKIRDVYRAIAEFEVQFTQMYDLSLNEGMLLCTLLNTPKLTSSEIAEALGLSASNTSKVIRSVEGKKLITRLIGKEDKRQMRFSLTTEGKNRISDIKNATFELSELLQQVVSLV